MGKREKQVKVKSSMIEELIIACNHILQHKEILDVFENSASRKFLENFKLSNLTKDRWDAKERERKESAGGALALSPTPLVLCAVRKFGTSTIRYLEKGIGFNFCH